MKAIILAAGLGSRLLPLTIDRPKCLVPVGGRTILEHQLEALHGAGVREVTVVGGYRFERLASFVHALPEERRPKLIFNPFYAVSSSIGSVWAARDLLAGPFLLLNGDTIHAPGPLAGAVRRLPEGLGLLIEHAPEAGPDDMRVLADLGRVLAAGKRLRDASHRSAGIVACTDLNGGGYRAALEQVIAAPAGDQRYHHDVIDLLARQLRVSAVTLEPGSFRELDSLRDIAAWLKAAA